MIYTGYFAKLKYYQSKGLTPFRISNGGSAIIGSFIKGFIPNWDIVSKHKSGLITDDQYKSMYIDQLNKLDRDYVSSQLSILDSQNSILLCYESPNKFCHRHILAEYIRNNFGIDVKEYKVI